MGSLREEALAYEPQTTLNIADLTAVPIDDLNLIHEEKEDSEGHPYSQNIVVIDGKRYRVPATVLEGIQTIIRLKPEVKNVKVIKSGEGKLTKYKVEPLE
jgi:hypothetical protein|tara:strand:- start:1762 stop:2061 length:300 start_codon:yes stop_codon:yes gene_type:complete